MTKTQAAGIDFQKPASRACYSRQWFPSKAWADAIEQTTKTRHTDALVKRAINDIVKNKGSTEFTVDDKCYEIYHHPKGIVCDGQKRTVDFFLVQPAGLKEPIISHIGAVWQKCYDDAYCKFRPRTTRTNPRPQPTTTGKRKHPSLQRLSNQDATKRQALLRDNQSSQPLATQDTNRQAPLPSRPVAAPTTLADKEALLRRAWAQHYPHLPYPKEFTANIVSVAVPVPVAAIPVVSPATAPKSEKKHGRFHLNDKNLNNGHTIKDVPSNRVIITSTEDGKNKVARAFEATVARFFKLKKGGPTLFTQHMYGALAATFPTVPSATLSIIIAIARNTMMCELFALIPDNFKYAFTYLVDLKRSCDFSPSASVIDSYVRSLAEHQAFYASYCIARAPRVSLQTDKAPDGSEVTIVRWHEKTDTTDSARGSVQEFHFGLQHTGKTSAEIAEGIHHATTNQLGLSNFKFYSITCDSGGMEHRNTWVRHCAVSIVLKTTAWQIRAVSMTANLHFGCQRNS